MIACCLRADSLQPRALNLENVMRPAAILAIVAVLALTGPAGRAQNVLPEDGRFTLHRTDEGYLRLDGRTGQVASCTRGAAGWMCQAVPDERNLMETEPHRRSPREPASQRMRTAIEKVWQRVVAMVADARNGFKGGT
jgi:hypothetical protein